MFITAVKVAAVEALRATFNDSYMGDINFRNVTTEYPEQSEQWPGLLVQFRPRGQVQWTGLHREQYQPLVDDPDYEWLGLVLGYFEGSIDLTVLATTAHERDRLWDALVELVLMGEDRADTGKFFTEFQKHDLVQITFNPAKIDLAGDSISPGTPWDRNTITYEATVRIDVIGQFTADPYNRRLVSFSDYTIYPYSPSPNNPDEEIYVGEPTYETDVNGDLVLDQGGNPIVSGVGPDDNDGEWL